MPDATSDIYKTQTKNFKLFSQNLKILKIRKFVLLGILITMRIVLFLLVVTTQVPIPMVALMVMENGKYRKNLVLLTYYSNFTMAQTRNSSWNGVKIKSYCLMVRDILEHGQVMKHLTATDLIARQIH